MTDSLYLDKFGVPNSVYPPTKYLTFGPWIYLVPQYKPESVLMLGYAGGTVAGLIRLLYGDIPITGVDIEIIDNRYGVELIKADAQEYIKTCERFDCVVVDLMPNDSPTLSPCVTDQEFVDNLSLIANYIIVNTFNNADMTVYKGLKLSGVNKPSGLANKIYYYEVVPIPELHMNI